MNRRHLKKRIRNAITNRKNRPLLYGVIFMIAAAATGLACGWSYVTDHSVRFNTYRSGRGFYRLPPLPADFDPATGKEQSTREIEQYDSREHGVEKAGEKNSVDPDKTWADAIAAIDADNPASTRALLESYLEQTQFRPYWDSHSGALESRQERRNTAFDLLDALGELGRGSKVDSIKTYLMARLLLTDQLAEIEKLLNAATPDSNLADNWHYLRAASLYKSDRKTEAIEAFKSHVSKFPKSEKNESAMYMIAKIMMERGDERAKECGSEECKVDERSESLQAFKEMLRRHPNGRFTQDAHSWIAHLYWREGKKAESLTEYYRLLGNTKSRQWRLEAKRSLQIIGHEHDEATLDKVEELIADEPETGLAYAYHRIYNHAIDFSYTEFNEWCCSGDYSWPERNEEAQRVKKEQDKGRHELRRIAKFSTAMVKRYGGSRVSGDFLVRVAEAQLELKNSTDALTLSNKALAGGVSGDSRAQALWVKGSAEHQQKKLASARTTFSQIVKDFPNHKLTEGARRLLAITAEDQDDLETALDQYIALGYRYDVAYFVDIHMPTDRLAKFVDQRKGSDGYNFLLYSLGIRYMRERRWAQSRETLRSVLTQSLPGVHSYGDNGYVKSSKEPEYWDDQNKGVIRTNWVMRDFQTINDLEGLEIAVAAAVNDEAKAEAMYQLASYQYDADELMFYNPAAWDGIRHELLYEFESGNNLRVAAESQGLFEYSKSHETLARAIPIYLDIVDLYPNTKAAKDALYSAVVAHEKLSDMNDYWRSVYGKGFFAGQRVVGNSDIRRMFPKFIWPISRLGWEASTRTVNGGAAYPSPPKPAPPLTRTQKFERRLKYASEKFGELIKPKIDSVTTWVGSGVSGYIAVVNYALSWLLTIVVSLLGGYLILLGFHYRTWLLAAAGRLRGTEIEVEQIPGSDSRIEKVIDEGS